MFLSGPTTGHPATSTTVPTNVGSAVVNTLILAANPDRLGATIYNDSNSRLFLKLGPVASLTSFTKRMQSQEYYEVPFGYTGIIEGIWSPVASRFARVTEFTE